MTTKVRCSHILVKHNAVRNPRSWRQDNVTRTKDEALEILKGYRAQITSGEKQFVDIAKEFSDCSSAKRGGDLGFFGRGEMHLPFEQASFALKVGQISEVCDTSSGVHIILRVA
mmetsp:Transcript_15569/g.17306  ORF Transcript_15569/g.17306 Transcript_15569/m.17306 type:complete len:114 (+) Transcript_15569:3-344(+)